MLDNELADYELSGEYLRADSDNSANT